MERNIFVIILIMLPIIFSVGCTSGTENYSANENGSQITGEIVEFSLQPSMDFANGTPCITFSPAELIANAGDKIIIAINQSSAGMGGQRMETPGNITPADGMAPPGNMTRPDNISMPENPGNAAMQSPGQRNDSNVMSNEFYFNIDELKVHAAFSLNNSTAVEFTVTKSGLYDYYASSGSTKCTSGTLKISS